MVKFTFDMKNRNQNDFLLPVKLKFRHYTARRQGTDDDNAMTSSYTQHGEVVSHLSARDSYEAGDQLRKYIQGVRYFSKSRKL